MDAKTIQDSLQWSDPSILLRVYALSSMEKRREAQDEMIAAMGLNSTAVHLMQ